MKLFRTERRDQKVKKLAGLVASTEDRALKPVVNRSTAEELALLFQLVPMARLNPMLNGVNGNLIRKAFSLVRTDAPENPALDDALDTLAEALRCEAATAPGARTTSAPPEIDVAAARNLAGDLDRPVCIRALDLAGRVLGGGNSDDKNG